MRAGLGDAEAGGDRGVLQQRDQHADSGGTLARNACGSTTRRSIWVKVMPMARAASAWPGGTVLMPERTASQTNAAV